LPITKRTIAKCWPHLLTSSFDPELIDDYGIQGSRLVAKTTIQKYEGENRTRVRELTAQASGASNAFMAS